MSDQPTNAQEALRLKERLTTITSGGESKPYLGKENAVTLFRRDYPISEGRGVIKTEPLQFEPPIFRAEIYIDDKLVATGHAAPEGKTNTFRKVESAAIRRALENAGYGTLTIIESIADMIGVDEAKRLLGSGKANGERRMGNGQPPQQRPPVTERAWTAAEAKAFNEDWISKGITQADQFKALGIKEKYSEWPKSRKAADAAVSAMLPPVQEKGA